MAITTTEYVLLSALTNQPMVTDNPDGPNQGGGEALGSAITLSGWGKVAVTQADIVTAMNAATIGPGQTRAHPAPENLQLAGMAADLYVKDGKAVIAYRGTQIKPESPTPAEENEYALDMQMNSGLLVGDVGLQVYAAYYFYKATIAVLTEISPALAATLTFTGHSLGGGLASLMAMHTGRQAVVFDPAPVLIDLPITDSTAMNFLQGVPALNEFGAEVLFGDVYWPPIPGILTSGQTADDVKLIGETYVTTITSYGDPLGLTSSASQAGANTTYHLRFDRDVFADSKIELPPEFFGVSNPLQMDTSLHSIYLVALQGQLITTGARTETDGTVSLNTALGTASDNLLDLMTQVFNPDVNLQTQIGNALDVAAGRERYDLFLRQLVNDKLNKGGVVTNMWLDDLASLASAVGRLGAAGDGTESGIKTEFEWSVMRALIQSAI